MNKINIKPISLNSAYRGRRFKTPELESFEREILYLLPNIKIPKGKLEAIYEFGVSSKNADVDNLIKITQDCIADTYRFNDKQIYKITVEKVDVSKGTEFIKFKIKSYENRKN